MGKRKMSKRAPGAVAALIAGNLLLLGIIAVLVTYLVFPDFYNHVWAEMFVHAEAVDGGMMEEAKVLPMLPFEQIETGTTESVNAFQVTEATEQLLSTLEAVNEEWFWSKLTAESAYVINEAGEVLFAKNEHEALYPASMTKLLTALVVVDQVEDLDEVKVIPDLYGCYESGSMLMNLDPGDSMSYRDLLHCMLMCSYNDAATSLALLVGGSLEDFSDLMNEKAEELGCVDSHFVTPHGLHDEEHYTSSYDMTLIVEAAVKNEIIQDILTTLEYTATLIGESGTVYAKYLRNSSYFLDDVYSIRGMEFTGGKTGYIFLARSCVATSFMDEEGHMYYSTVMKALDAQYMTALIYDYLMDPFKLLEFAKETPVMEEWQLEYEEGFYE